MRWTGKTRQGCAGPVGEFEDAHTDLLHVRVAPSFTCKMPTSIDPALLAGPYSDKQARDVDGQHLVDILRRNTSMNPADGPMAYALRLRSVTTDRPTTWEGYSA
jgi:hypothetical protein